MDFGFTNDRAKWEGANVYREAAIAGGWTCEATYKSEPVDSAATLSRDGWKLSIISRDKSDKGGKWKYEASVHVWAPDGLQVTVSNQYDFEQLKAAIRNCNECGADDVETTRYSFAGRWCLKCNSSPELNKKYHYHGWCD